MWITDQDLENEIDMRRPAAATGNSGPAPQCECPDFCLVQHDNDN